MLEYERRISAAKSTARMQRTLERKEQVLEERRQAVMAAEAAAEMRMQQKEEVRRHNTLILCDSSVGAEMYGGVRACSLCFGFSMCVHAGQAWWSNGAWLCHA
jgi:hypothetical protein